MQTRWMAGGVGRDRRLLVIGDSVIRRADAAFAGLRGFTVSVDARPCRQAIERVDGCGEVDIPSALDALHTGVESFDPDIAVFHIGHNGRVSVDQFDRIMQDVPAETTAAWLTLNEPRAWEQPNNLVFEAGVARWPGSLLIDWKADSLHKPWFEPDDLHVNKLGARRLVRLVRRELRGVARGARSG